MMTSETDPTNKVYEAMRKWAWQISDPDGNLMIKEVDLSLAANRLAMDGHSKPQEALLDLLSTGYLQSRGSYNWRKFEAGNYFQLEGSQEHLNRKRWETLSNTIEAEWKGLGTDEWPIFSHDLEKLGLSDCPPYEWEFTENSFSITLCPPGLESYDPSYFEEWFTAWNIKIWPFYVGTEYDSDTGFDNDDSVQSENVRKVDKGGRPPAANWEAAVLELSGRYYVGDFKPNTLADVKRELREVLAKDGVDPADSTIGNHAKPIFDAFQAWENDAQKPG